jgi:hypothetical protein
MSTEVSIAEKHVKDILSLVFNHSAERKALIVADAQSPLAVTLGEAYRRALPTAQFIHFDQTESAEILATFKELNPLDLVVLIQSTSFRLKDFRVRVELFEQSLKVIEHPHLARMIDAEARYYLDALAYDPIYYRTLGHALKKRIDCALGGVVESGSERLVFHSPFEPAKLNIGDYSEMKNIGGQFPIGEVFTEAKDLEAVNGRVQIFAFGDTSFSVCKVDTPITLVIQKGKVIDVENSTEEFDKVLANIRADEGDVWMRELGFGINRGFTKEKIVRDIGTYERMCGVHLSLGAKHTVYKKPNFKRNDTWHHVDVFVDTTSVYLDEERIFADEAWGFLGL